MSIFSRRGPGLPADAVSRQVSVFSKRPIQPSTDAVSREFTLLKGTKFDLTDAVSREITIGKAKDAPVIGDAVSREFTIGRILPKPPVSDAISRELTIGRVLPKPPIIDAASRQLTVLRNRPVQKADDGISRQLTLYTKRPSSSRIDDGVSREATLDAPVPDLVVESPGAAAEIWTDTYFAVRWTDRNNGKGSARGTWIDRVLLSDDDQLGNDVPLSDFSYSGIIRPTQAAARRNEVLIPTDKVTGAAQDKWLIFQADVTDTQFERSAETNNWIALKIRVKRAPKPDLVIKPGSLIVSPTAFSEQEVEVRFTVQNVGTASTDASEWADWVHVSPDDNPHLNDPVRVPIANSAYLDPGEEYTSTARVSIPRGSFGDYKIVVFTDGDQPLQPNTVRESDETNNTASASLKVTIAPYPDLQVTSVTAPTQAFAGGKIDVSWRAKNAGTSKVPVTQAAWGDRVYFSKDDKLDGSDRRAEISYRTAGLAVDETYTVQNFSVTVPKDIQGDWYVLVQADDENRVYEFVYEGNNTGVSSVDGKPRITKITITPPDLIVTAFKVPTTAKGGENFFAEWTVKNQGAFETDAGPWVDTVYMSKDNKLDGSDSVMGDFVQAGPLKAGASYSRKESLKLGDCENGDRWFFVVTDRSNRIVEFDDKIDAEANNTSSAQAFKADANAPNLKVTALSVPAGLTAGSNFTVNWTVGNSGVGATKQVEWTDAIILSRDASGLVEPRVLGLITHVGALAPGSAYNASATMPTPIDTFGSYYITVVTDYSSIVPECDNEGDNSRASGILPVTSNLPNLTVASVSPDARWKVGTTTTVKWVGTNRGPGGLTTASWQDRVWLSRDKVLDSGDLTVGASFLTLTQASGTSYNTSATFTVPLVASGDWYVFVQTDAAGQIYEGANEGDNISGASLIRIDTPDVDLIVPSVDAPETAVAGQSITVRWTITNSGLDKTLTSNWLDRVFLSRDRVLDPSDLPMGWAIRNDVLIGGANYSSSATFTIPPGISGPYYTLVLADVGNAVWEKSPDGELNNVGNAIGAIQISLPPPVDLRVESVTPPSVVELGTDLIVSFKVKNYGTRVATGPWTDAVYLSKDKVWSSDDELLGRQIRAGELAAGATYDGQIATYLPGVEPGPYYLIARTDVRNSEREIDESNNNRSSDGTMTATVRTIPTGSWSDVYIDWSRPRYVRTPTKAGDTLQWDLDDPLADAWNDLYVKVNAVARLFNYDARSAPFQTDPRAVLQETANGAAYATFQVKQPVNSVRLAKIRPVVVPFGITDVSPKRVGNYGRVSFDISGGMLKNLKSAVLTSASTTINATEIVARNAVSARVRFGLKGITPGRYDLAITSTSGAVSRLQGIEIEHGGKYDAATSTSTTSIVRRGQSIVQTAVIRNTGNVDIPVGLVQIRVPISGAKIWVDRPITTLPQITGDALSPSGRPFTNFDLGGSTVDSFIVLNLAAGESLTVRVRVELPSNAPLGIYPIDVSLQAFDSVTWDKLVRKLLEQVRLRIIASGVTLKGPIAAALASEESWWNFFRKGQGYPGGGAGGGGNWGGSGGWSGGGSGTSGGGTSGGSTGGGSGGSSGSTGGTSGGSSSGGGGVTLPPPPDKDDPGGNGGSGGSGGSGLAKGLCEANCALQAATSLTGAYESVVSCSVATLNPEWCGLVFIFEAAYVSASLKCCLNDCRGTKPIECGFEDVICNIVGGALPTSLGSAFEAMVQSGQFPEELSQAKLQSIKRVGVCLLRAVDPNDLIGPTSYGDANYLSPQKLWTYRTRFENVATAQAAANRVRIESFLPTALDRRTVRLNAVGLAGQTLELGNEAFVSQRRRLTLGGKDLDVYISGGIDVVTGKVSLEIEAIDPDTGEPPSSPLVGLLLPEDGSGRGNGYFEFSVLPAATATNGTKVSLQAAIQFDTEPVITTNIVTNTIESLVPSSKIDALPATSSSEAVTLTYRASDPTPGSGVDGVDIWMQINNGAWQRVVALNRAGTVSLNLPKGSTYRFYSIAVDKVGNAELPPTNASGAIIPDTVISIR